MEDAEAAAGWTGRGEQQDRSLAQTKFVLAQPAPQRSQKQGHNQPGDKRRERDAAELDPRTAPAKIRAFFVDPDWVRRGLGTRILEQCEKAAYAEGFRRFEMGATLTGVAMYAARGYKEAERIEVPLRGGLTLPVIRMWKAVE